MTTATLVALGTTTAAGVPMEPRSSLRLAIAQGVVGDRYERARNAGHFKGHPDMEVTLVEEEDAHAVGVEPLALRRNLVTRGVSLESLVGRTFRVGGAVLHGVRPCLPCGYLEKHLARPGLKAALRGGLRARIVQPGEVRVGDAVEPIAVRLDADMRAVVEAAHLAFVATVTAEGLPNLSPKGTIRVLDDERLFFLDIASPQTRKSIAANPWMEVNVVDATSRRGYRFFGRASAHEGDDVHRAAQERVFREDGAEYPNGGAIVLHVERALPLVSPGYDTVEDERAMRAAWKPKRAALDTAFEAHVEARGPYSRER